MTRPTSTRFDQHATAPPSTHEWQQREEANERSQQAADLAHAQRSADPDAAAHLSPARYRALQNTPEADTEAASRMSTAQLRDRLEHMEATAARTTPPKSEKPSDRINRAGKIRTYRAELDRRTAAEAEADSQAERGNAATAGARIAAEQPVDGLPTFHHATPVPVIAPPKNETTTEAPAMIQCHRCASVLQPDDAGQLPPHVAIAGITCPADPREFAPANTADAERIAHAAERRQARQAVPCPTCHAAAGAPCTNYRGQNCITHGARQAPRSAPAPEPPRDTAHTAEHRAAKHAAELAAERRRSVVATIREATAPAPPPEPGARPIKHAPDADLMDRLAALLSDYTLGTVIEATWEADRKRFNAAKERKPA